MEKSKIVVVSSDRSLMLAEALRDVLQSNFVEARLWNEGVTDQPSELITETLERAFDQYDYAVILLTRDALMTGEQRDTSADRDNVIFEAGFFLAALGSERCFIVSNLGQGDLPSDLAGLMLFAIDESKDLTNRTLCTEAILDIGEQLKNVVGHVGRMPSRRIGPLLSVDEMFNRERPLSDGGDLTESQIIVCDVQPMSRADLGARVRRNIDQGLSYVYFLANDKSIIQKFIQSLQMVLVAGLSKTEESLGFRERLELVKAEKTRILGDLKRICETRSLLVTLLPEEPVFRFRLHNANDAERARLYMKYHGLGFILWAEGYEAAKVWDTLPSYWTAPEDDRIFVPLNNYTLEGREKQEFKDIVSKELSKYFPGIDKEVRNLCFGTSETAHGLHPTRG